MKMLFKFLFFATLALSTGSEAFCATWSPTAAEASMALQPGGVQKLTLFFENFAGGRTTCTSVKEWQKEEALETEADAVAPPSTSNVLFLVKAPLPPIDVATPECRQNQLDAFRLCDPTELAAIREAVKKAELQASIFHRPTTDACSPVTDSVEASAAVPDADLTKKQCIDPCKELEEAITIAQRTPLNLQELYQHVRNAYQHRMQVADEAKQKSFLIFLYKFGRLLLAMPELQQSEELLFITTCIVSHALEVAQITAEELLIKQNTAGIKPKEILDITKRLLDYIEAATENINMATAPTGTVLLKTIGQINLIALDQSNQAYSAMQERLDCIYYGLKDMIVPYCHALELAQITANELLKALTRSIPPTDEIVTLAESLIQFINEADDELTKDNAEAANELLKTIQKINLTTLDPTNITYQALQERLDGISFEINDRLSRPDESQE